MPIQRTKASNQPVLVVSFGYMPNPCRLVRQGGTRPAASPPSSSRSVPCRGLRRADRRPRARRTSAARQPGPSRLKRPIDRPNEGRLGILAWRAVSNVSIAPAEKPTMPIRLRIDVPFRRAFADQRERGAEVGELWRYRAPRSSRGWAALRGRPALANISAIDLERRHILRGRNQSVLEDEGRYASVRESTGNVRSFILH